MANKPTIEEPVRNSLQPMIDEFDIRQWFLKTDLAEAITTHAIVEGIIQGRQQAEPKRKRRSDAGKARHDGQDKLL